MIVFLGVVALLVLVLLARRRRKVVLSGLSSVKPVFHVSPPSRSHSKKKREVL